MAGSLLAEEPIPVPVATSGVRLHPSEAWITRSGVARILTGGVHRVAISRLPADLRLEDIRVTARGPAGTRVGELTLRQSPQVYVEWPEWKRWVAEKERIERAITRLNQRKELLLKASQFSQELMDIRFKTVQRLMGFESLNPKVILDLADFVQSRRLELDRQEVLLDEETHHLEAEQQRTNDAQKRIQSEASANATTVLAELETEGSAVVTVCLAFRTTQALWRPTYEARLSPDRSKLEFVLFAAVKQETGEAWAGVELELVNQNSTEHLDLPAVSALPALNYREDKSAKAALLVPDRPVRGTSQAVLRIPGRVEVRKDEEQRFRLTSVDLFPRFHYLAIPRQGPDVHLVALVVPPAEFPLVDGSSVDLLQGSERLGTLNLEAPAPGEALHLSFGAVPGLRAQHQWLERGRAEVGDKAKEREWTFRERMDIESTLAAPVEVEIEDRVVASGTDSVRVDQASPGWSLKRPGLRSCMVQLGPNAKTSLELRTLVRGPLVGKLVNLGDLVLEGN